MKEYIHCEHTGSASWASSKIAICNFGRGVMTSSDSLRTATAGPSAEWSKGVSSQTLESVIGRWRRGEPDAEPSTLFYLGVQFHLSHVKINTGGRRVSVSVNNDVENLTGQNKRNSIIEPSRRFTSPRGPGMKESGLDCTTRYRPSTIAENDPLHPFIHHWDELRSGRVSFRG